MCTQHVPLCFQRVEYLRSELLNARAAGPGSHRLLYRGLSDEVNFVPNEHYHQLLAQAKEQIAPIEFLGGVGDVQAPLNILSVGISAMIF
eukprot:COSAG02_NODE_23541_length_715_cov_1.400974_2_plen_90_part_00